MAEILVRNLDEKTVKHLKKRAKKAGRSLQSEAKLILELAVSKPEIDMETAREVSMRFQRKLKGRKFPDTVALIREDRER